MAIVNAGMPESRVRLVLLIGVTNALWRNASKAASATTEAIPVQRQIATD
jgi:hypothetical protein